MQFHELPAQEYQRLDLVDIAVLPADNLASHVRPLWIGHEFDARHHFIHERFGIGKIDTDEGAQADRDDRCGSRLAKLVVYIDAGPAERENGTCGPFLGGQRGHLRKAEHLAGVATRRSDRDVLYLASHA
jgi:hypothetical protein